MDKSQIIFGQRQLYMNSCAATKFWLGGTDFVKPNYPQIPISPRILVTLFWKSWKIQKFWLVLFKKNCKSHYFWGGRPPSTFWRGGEASPPSPPSGVQCWLTASTGLRVDRHHTPRSCGYDVGAVTLKSKEVTFTSFFLTFFSCNIIKQDYEHICRSGSLSWFLLESGAGKRRHIKFVDVWLLWQLGLRVDP